MSEEIQNDSEGIQKNDVLAELRNSGSKWIPSVSGGVASAVATFLLVILPVVNTWLANAKEISLAQLKVAQDQLDYKDSRKLDAEKERDLYKKEMLEAHQAEREAEAKFFSCQRELREFKK
jgi:hypothetical protein